MTSWLRMRLSSTNFMSVSMEVKIKTLPKHYLTRSFPVIQKQPSTDVPIKRCYEKKHQIYLETPMPKCDFNKIAKQLLKSKFRMGVLLYICCTFSEHLWRIASE